MRLITSLRKSCTCWLIIQNESFVNWPHKFMILDSTVWKVSITSRIILNHNLAQLLRRRQMWLPIWLSQMIPKIHISSRYRKWHPRRPLEVVLRSLTRELSRSPKKSVLLKWLSTRVGCGKSGLESTGIWLTLLLLPQGTSRECTASVKHFFFIDLKETVASNAAWMDVFHVSPLPVLILHYD